MLNPDLLEHIISKSGFSLKGKPKVRSVGGGSINQAYQVSSDKFDLFVKLNSGVDPSFFEAEKRGLEILSDNSEFEIPQVFTSGKSGGYSFLSMEYFDATKRQSDYWFTAGQRLARMHQVREEEFGLSFNNFMGALPQNNAPLENWAEFFIERRLKPQVELAMNKGLMDISHQKLFEKLYTKLDSLVPTEKPSLIHGDLWSGNIMSTNSGEATIIDPAVHYGHRESDLAMTQMFGGFSSEFYKGYESIYPLEPDFSSRIGLLNLYPLLIHVNLFGLGYLRETINNVKRFI
ncbi:fructosamine kinase family protein [Mangrovivirga sp. M17]|uniref:Fructosamine kinase family protein n=1 Tax=Mangrovivirga halotolerans TaxID=2993936 RepID=A0ABT3RMN8_9BACT|nr:fructosamine kinase family protein [Mangrovivirga halotolerans]MCX2742846.1 fructosamine kinase family protein [Mangrovivirga halotolerans]